MGIFNRWGAGVDILGNAGEQRAPYLRVADTLLKVRYRFEDGDTSEHYTWGCFLKADGGAEELFAAIAAAPRLTLDADELALAFKDAR